MNLEFVGTLVAIFMIRSTVGDPTLVLKYTHFKITNFENPYLDEFSGEISDIGDINITCSIKKPLPENMIVSSTFEKDGLLLAEYESSLCDLMNTEFFKKDIVKHGFPKNKFPKECPVAPGNYKVLNSRIPKDRFPLGIPDGDYEYKGNVSLPDSPIFSHIHSITNVYHETPKLPVPGLGR